MSQKWSPPLRKTMWGQPLEILVHRDNFKNRVSLEFCGSIIGNAIVILELRKLFKFY